MTPIWQSELAPGAKWSATVGRGRLVKFTALKAGANVSLLLYNAHQLSERYNMPDTLKAQHTFHLTQPHVLMSDNGCAMASIVDDQLGWHDTVGGYTDRMLTDARYGPSPYQVHRNQWLRSGQENFAMELMRNGLSVRDLVPPLNLFSKVSVDPEGTMTYDPHHCSAGASITLRTEMDLLWIASNTPHPLDLRTPFPSVPVRVEVFLAQPLTADDPCIRWGPENQRAFENTWASHTLRQPIAFDLSEGGR